MLNKTLKVVGLVGALVAAPSAFAGGMGGMGMGGFGMGGFGGNAVLTSNGVMFVNSARGFSGDDFRTVSAVVMPTTFSNSRFDGDDRRLVTVPAAGLASVPATAVVRVRSESFESRGVDFD